MDLSVFFKTCFILIIAAIICTLLKRLLPEYSIILSTLVVALAICAALINGAYLINKIKQIYENLSLNNYHFAEILKILGICVLTQLTSNILKDTGETALALVAEIAGKISILYFAFPIITNFINFVIKLLK